MPAKRTETVVSQLQAALAVDEKYASLDPILKKMEDRVASADVSEGEKQAFLKGMKNSMEKSLAPRITGSHRRGLDEKYNRPV